MLTFVLAITAAIQLLLTAASKLRHRGAADGGPSPLSGTRVAVVFAVVDVVIAGLLVFPGTRLAGLLALCVLTAGGIALSWRVAGESDCGCFGSGASSSRARDLFAKALMLAEAVVALTAMVAHLQSGLSPWLYVLLGVACSALLIGAEPSLIPRPGVRRSPSRRAYGQLLASPHFQAWRPFLLSDDPSSARQSGGAVVWTFEAIVGERLVTVIFRVSPWRVRVMTHDVDVPNGYLEGA